ncbi:piggyBac transposable element-derived protein 4 [Trichonephila clavipes]|nr:piggyBac transposable element-derived protein 4 [Trichonephila clavipes]
MAARKRSAIESVYIPNDLSDSESDFSFENDSDINFSDCSSSSDESDHDSINLRSVRQWYKIDMKNIPPPTSPVPFRGNPGITVNIANNATCRDILVTEKTDTYGTVNKTRKDLPVNFSKEKVPKEEIVAYQRGKVMALKWQDKKSVCLMSTIHDASSYLVTCKNLKRLL